MHTYEYSPIGSFQYLVEAKNSKLFQNLENVSTEKRDEWRYQEISLLLKCEHSKHHTQPDTFSCICVTSKFYSTIHLHPRYLGYVSFQPQLQLSRTCCPREKAVSIIFSSPTRSAHSETSGWKAPLRDESTPRTDGPCSKTLSSQSAAHMAPGVHCTVAAAPGLSTVASRH